MKTLIKHLLLIKSRTSFQSRKTLYVRLVGMLYFLSIYYILVGRFVLFLDTLYGTESITIIMTLAYIATSIFIFIFSFLPIISILYYSPDINFYLYLPIKKRDLLISKMFVLSVAHYIVIILVYTPIVLHLSLNYKLTFIFYLTLLIKLFYIPIIPISTSMILVITVMKFIKISKKRHVFIKNAIIVLTVILLCGITYIFINYDSPLINELQTIYSNNLTTLNLYPPSILINFAFNNPNTSSFLLFLLLMGGLSFIIFWISVFIGDRIYDPNSYKRVKKINCYQKHNSFFILERREILSLLIQELRHLIRKPVLFIKGLVSAIFVPILCVSIFIFNRQLEGIVLFVNQNEMLAFVLLICFTISTLGWNPIAISSFSRDKNELLLRHTFPIIEKKIWFVKVFVSWFFFLPAIILYATIFHYFLGVSLHLLSMWAFLTVFITIYGSIICTIFDGISPTLRWNSEQQLFRNRTVITLFHIINSMLVAIIGILGAIISKYFKYNFNLLFIVYLIIFLLINLSSIWFLKRNSSDIYKKVIC